MSNLRDFIWDEGTADFSDKKIHYYYHITKNTLKKPPILLLHGLSDNGMCYARVGRQFVDKHDVYLLDARAHGKSTDPISWGGFNIEKFVADVPDVMEKLKLPPAILIGHSMGSAQAVGVAAWYPEKVKALVLEDPPIFESRFLKTMLWLTLTMVGSRKPENPPKSFEFHLERSHRMNKNWVDEDYEVWAKGQQEFSTHTLKVFCRGIRKAPDWKTLFPNIKCPILALSAENGILRPSVFEKMRRIVPQVEIKRVFKTGHNIRRDQYQVFMENAKEFLARIAGDQ